jgi:hypothetical protein
VKQTESAVDAFYNCGEGDAAQRMSAVLWQMNNASTPVTRQVCRQIVAEKLAENQPKVHP